MNKKILANELIRSEAKKNNVPLWVIADELGLSDSSFSKMLRYELSDDDREKILTIIKNVASKGGKSHV